LEVNENNVKEKIVTNLLEALCLPGDNLKEVTANVML